MKPVMLQNFIDKVLDRSFQQQQQPPSHSVSSSAHVRADPGGGGDPYLLLHMKNGPNGAGGGDAAASGDPSLRGGPPRLPGSSSSSSYMQAAMLPLQPAFSRQPYHGSYAAIGSGGGAPPGVEPGVRTQQYSFAGPLVSHQLHQQQQQISEVQSSPSFGTRSQQAGSHAGAPAASSHYLHAMAVGSSSSMQQQQQLLQQQQLQQQQLQQQQLQQMQQQQMQQLQQQGLGVGHVHPVGAPGSSAAAARHHQSSSGSGSLHHQVALTYGGYDALTSRGAMVAGRQSSPRGGGSGSIMAAGATQPPSALTSPAGAQLVQQQQQPLSLRRSPASEQPSPQRPLPAAAARAAPSSPTAHGNSSSNGSGVDVRRTADTRDPAMAMSPVHQSLDLGVGVLYDQRLAGFGTDAASAAAAHGPSIEQLKQQQLQQHHQQRQLQLQQQQLMQQQQQHQQLMHQQHQQLMQHQLQKRGSSSAGMDVSSSYGSSLVRGSQSLGMEPLKPDSASGQAAAGPSMYRGLHLSNGGSLGAVSLPHGMPSSVGRPAYSPRHAPPPPSSQQQQQQQQRSSGMRASNVPSPSVRRSSGSDGGSDGTGGDPEATLRRREAEVIAAPWLQADGSGGGGSSQGPAAGSALPKVMVGSDLLGHPGSLSLAHSPTGATAAQPASRHQPPLLLQHPAASRGGGGGSSSVVAVGSVPGPGQVSPSSAFIGDASVQSPSVAAFARPPLPPQQYFVHPGSAAAALQHHGGAAGHAAPYTVTAAALHQRQQQLNRRGSGGSAGAAAEQQQPLQLQMPASELGVASQHKPPPAATGAAQQMTLAAMQHHVRHASGSSSSGCGPASAGSAAACCSPVDAGVGACSLPSAQSPVDDEAAVAQPLDLSAKPGGARPASRAADDASSGVGSGRPPCRRPGSAPCDGQQPLDLTLPKAGAGVSDRASQSPRAAGVSDRASQSPRAAATQRLPAAPQMAASHMAAPQMAAPQMASPQMASPQMASPQMASPQMASPQMFRQPPSYVVASNERDLRLPLSMSQGSGSAAQDSIGSLSPSAQPLVVQASRASAAYGAGHYGRGLESPDALARVHLHAGMHIVVRPPMGSGSLVPPGGQGGAMATLAAGLQRHVAAARYGPEPRGVPHDMAVAATGGHGSSLTSPPPHPAPPQLTPTAATAVTAGPAAGFAGNALQPTAAPDARGITLDSAYGTAAGARDCSAIAGQEAASQMQPLSSVTSLIGSHPLSDILFLHCTRCQSSYGSVHGFRKHFRNAHGHNPSADDVQVQSISATRELVRRQRDGGDGQLSQPVLPSGGRSNMSPSGGGGGRTQPPHQGSASSSQRSSWDECSSSNGSSYGGSCGNAELHNGGCGSQQQVTSQLSDASFCLHCLYCGRQFSTAEGATFEEHVLQHERQLSGGGTRNGRGEHSVAATSASGVQLQHQQQHREVHSYRCYYCGTRVADASSLREHLLQHDGLMHFVCSFCAVAYSTASAANEHMSACHQGLLHYAMGNGDDSAAAAAAAENGRPTAACDTSGLDERPDPAAPAALGASKQQRSGSTGSGSTGSGTGEPCWSGGSSANVTRDRQSPTKSSGGGSAWRRGSSVREAQQAPQLRGGSGGSSSSSIDATSKWRSDAADRSVAHSGPLNGLHAAHRDGAPLQRQSEAGECSSPADRTAAVQLVQPQQLAAMTTAYDARGEQRHAMPRTRSDGQAQALLAATAGQRGRLQDGPFEWADESSSADGCVEAEDLSTPAHDASGSAAAAEQAANASLAAAAGSDDTPAAGAGQPDGTVQGVNGSSRLGGGSGAPYTLAQHIEAAVIRELSRSNDGSAGNGTIAAGGCYAGGSRLASPSSEQDRAMQKQQLLHGGGAGAAAALTAAGAAGTACCGPVGCGGSSCLLRASAGDGAASLNLMALLDRVVEHGLRSFDVTPATVGSGSGSSVATLTRALVATVASEWTGGGGGAHCSPAVHLVRGGALTAELRNGDGGDERYSSPLSAPPPGSSAAEENGSRSGGSPATAESDRSGAITAAATAVSRSAGSSSWLTLSEGSIDRAEDSGDDDGDDMGDGLPRSEPSTTPSPPLPDVSTSESSAAVRSAGSSAVASPPPAEHQALAAVVGQSADSSLSFELPPATRAGDDGITSAYGGDSEGGQSEPTRAGQSADASGSNGCRDSPSWLGLESLPDRRDEAGRCTEQPAADRADLDRSAADCSLQPTPSPAGDSGGGDASAAEVAAASPEAPSVMSEPALLIDEERCDEDSKSDFVVSDDDGSSSYEPAHKVARLSGPPE